MAVKEYVLCIIAALQNMNFLTGSHLRAGVIGVGRIGRLVAEELKLMGFDVVLCDPIRAEQEPDFISVPLEKMDDLDFITLHTPLTVEGDYPTYHMIDKNFLQRQKPGCILLNAGRGSVINSVDLKNSALHWCLDVWENEPNIDKDLLKKTLIATPHIAGYSIQSKYRGIEMIYQIAAAKKFIPDQVKAIEFPQQTILLKNEFNEQKDILRIYNPMHTSQQMKDAILNQHDTFDNLRKNFIERHEFDYVRFHYA
jgi:erythronate-4-phosphate dehydrogenase